MKRKRPPVESIITIDDSDENPDDENPPEKKKFKKLKEDLTNYLVNVRKAKYMSKGEEEENMMTLEDCPKCSAPQILPDKSVSLYHCPVQSVELSHVGSASFRHMATGSI